MRLNKFRDMFCVLLAFKTTILCQGANWKLEFHCVIPSASACALFLILYYTHIGIAPGTSRSNSVWASSSVTNICFFDSCALDFDKHEKYTLKVTFTQCCCWTLCLSRRCVTPSCMVTIDFMRVKKCVKKKLYRR